MTPLELLAESKRNAAQRDPIDLVIDWRAQFLKSMSGALAAAVFGPGSNTPIAVCSTDIRGAHWIAKRLNRAAWLEQCVTNLRDGLLSASAESDVASVPVGAVLSNLDEVLRGPPPAISMSASVSQRIAGQ